MEKLPKALCSEEQLGEPAGLPGGASETERPCPHGPEGTAREAEEPVQAVRGEFLKDQLDAGETVARALHAIHFLEGCLSALLSECEEMKRKAGYYDELVERNFLSNFRVTAKQIGIGEKAFIRFLLGKGYLYRDQQGKLMPYAKQVARGLFEVKECCNEKNEWSGVQTLVTPAGRETFRQLTKELKNEKD